MTKLWLVGDKNATKKNSWAAMTNSEEEAQRILKEDATLTTIKVIEAPQGRRKAK